MRQEHNEDRRSFGVLSFEDGSVINYRIIKSNRKTMAIQISKTGEVSVRLPSYVSFSSGHELILKNKNWVFEKQKKISVLSPAFHPRIWRDGSEVLLFGKTRILHLQSDFTRKSFLVEESPSHLILTGPWPAGESKDSQNEVKTLLYQWYRNRAGQYLKEKTAAWSQIMRIDYGRISIRDQATRWGSCSGKGNLNFNWRLILLPEELADYVVVHELAHRFQMNHSKAFWSIVEKEIPDYLSRRKKLRTYESEIYQKY